LKKENKGENWQFRVFLQGKLRKKLGHSWGEEKGKWRRRRRDDGDGSIIVGRRKLRSASVAAVGR
jgi:hypothetical protein